MRRIKRNRGTCASARRRLCGWQITAMRTPDGGTVPARRDRRRSFGGPVKPLKWSLPSAVSACAPVQPYYGSEGGLFWRPGRLPFATRRATARVWRLSRVVCPRVAAPHLSPARESFNPGFRTGLGMGRTAPGHFRLRLTNPLFLRNRTLLRSVLADERAVQTHQGRQSLRLQISGSAPRSSRHF